MQRNVEDRKNCSRLRKLQKRNGYGDCWRKRQRNVKERNEWAGTMIICTILTQTTHLEMVICSPHLSGPKNWTKKAWQAWAERSWKFEIGRSKKRIAGSWRRSVFMICVTCYLVELLVVSAVWYESIVWIIVCHAFEVYYVHLIWCDIYSVSSANNWVKLQFGRYPVWIPAVLSVYNGVFKEYIQFSRFTQ